jgi:hypothetical protein
VETFFSGYVKQFKWWNSKRSDFEILEFRAQKISAGDPRVLSSYSMDEDDLEFVYYDSGFYQETYTVNPAWSMTLQAYFSPITLHFCEAGFYVNYNPLFFSYECA